MAGSNPIARLWRRLAALRAAFTRNLALAYAEESLRRQFPDVLISEGVIIKRPDRFFPGKGVAIHDRAYLNCAGGAWNGGAGFIRFGDNVEIGPYAVLWGAGGISLGNNVHVGDHVSMTAHEARHIRPEQHDIWKPLEFDMEPIVVEDHVLICPHATIIPGIHIGHHAMVAPGAVVIRDVAPCTLVAGVPAKTVRELTEDEVADRERAGSRALHEGMEELRSP